LLLLCQTLLIMLQSLLRVHTIFGEFETDPKRLEVPVECH
jgi:hypothetical protein